MSDWIKFTKEKMEEGISSLKNIKKEKAEYKAYLARVKGLPEDFKFVYEKMCEYMWSYSGGGSGYDMIALQEGLLELFETSAAEGKTALEVTGSDVAAFCDELLRNALTYTEKRREQLNREVQEKLRGNPRS